MVVTSAKPQTKLELEEVKLSKIKDNTKLMLEKKKNAQLKMEELKQQIAEQSKAMKEEIRKADQKLKTNQTALKAVQAKIKKIKQDGDSGLTKDSGAAMGMSFLASMGSKDDVKKEKRKKVFGLF